MKVMPPLMSPLVRRDSPRQMGAFRAMCEENRAAHPEPH
jgi:hypothetical protein